jgi:hypothetical protein
MCFYIADTDSFGAKVVLVGAIADMCEGWTLLVIANSANGANTNWFPQENGNNYLHV